MPPASPASCYSSPAPNDSETNEGSAAPGTASLGTDRDHQRGERSRSREDHPNIHDATPCTTTEGCCRSRYDVEALPARRDRPAAPVAIHGATTASASAELPLPIMRALATAATPSI